MTVGLEFAGDIAVLTLDRPAALNALNADMIGKLGGCLDTIAASEARGVVVVGAGERAFCAGADIGELRGRSPAQHREGIALGQATFARLAALPIPTVAVIRGLALGGGLELAMSCSYRVVLAGARLGLPEIKLGLIPGYGGTQRLPRLVGSEAALDLILSGRVVTAEEALRIGLVDELADELAGEGDAVSVGIDFLARKSEGRPAAAHLARQAVLAAASLDLDAGLRAEATLFALAAQTTDAREGIEAFLEKRAPQFVGR